MSLTNTQYDELMRQYNQRQLKAHEASKRLKAKLYRHNPRLAQIDSEIASGSIAQTKAFINGHTDSLTELSESINVLIQEKETILRALGYTPEDLKPHYFCPDCQDTGYIHGKKCHCFRQAEVDLIYQQSNLRTILSRENFDTYDYSYYSDTLIDPESNTSALALARHAVQKSKDFIKIFDLEHPNLLLYGSTGTGKTFLTNCIARELLHTGHSVIYFSAFQLFDILAKNVFGKAAESSADYHNIFNCDLLIIDDLGTEVPNAFTVSQFFQCLNERVLRNRSTIISTNLHLQDIASIYSERIASRLTSHFTILKLFGEDIRILKKLSD